MAEQGQSPGRSALFAALLQAVLVLFTFAVLYPLLRVLKVAVSGEPDLDASLSVIPPTLSGRNFADFVAATDEAGNWIFGHQLWNSLAVAALTTVVGLALATTAAYAFSRFRFPGRKTGLMLFLVSQMFPGVLMMVPLYVILSKIGLLNRQAGLVLVYSTTAIPFCVWMLKGYFDTIPKDLEESALIDGASRLTIFLKIVLPLSAPAVAVTALFSFMTAWNEFILAATFMSDRLAYTLPVTLASYVGEHDVQWGLFAAASLLVSIPVVGLFYALQRHLVSGLTAGSVKG
jgi:arabinogalactan oligomer / maltooligosaccharide transport system permease protein